MFELLTTKESSQAALQGWQLCWVYDPVTKRTTADVLAVGTARQIRHAQAASRAVVNLAKAGDIVAQRALQLVMKSRQSTPAKKAAKKK